MSTLQVIQFVTFLFPYLEATIRHWKGHVFTHHPKKVHPLGMVLKKNLVYKWDDKLTISTGEWISQISGWKHQPYHTSSNDWRSRYHLRSKWKASVVRSIGRGRWKPGRSGEVLGWCGIRALQPINIVFLLVIKSDKKGLFFWREVIGSSMKHWVWF